MATTYQNMRLPRWCCTGPAPAPAPARRTSAVDACGNNGQWRRLALDQTFTVLDPQRRRCSRQPTGWFATMRAAVLLEEIARRGRPEIVDEVSLS
jgi:hypothetical protein